MKNGHSGRLETKCFPEAGVLLSYMELRSNMTKRSARAHIVRWTMALRRPERREDALRRHRKMSQERLAAGGESRNRDSILYREIKCVGG